MKIYTKTGDGGETSYLGGTRVSKADVRLEAYGTVDELNSWVGVLADYTINESRLPALARIQDRLFIMGSLLAKEPGKIIEGLPALSEADVTALEQEIDAMNETLEPLRNFILPRGHKEVSFAHVGRTVCRRAERCVVRLSQQEPVDAFTVRYLNRLSDYLFVLCRAMAKDLGVKEIVWKP